ncbi:sensor histidine kinase [Sulfitobacter sabulilitoris]|uniref:histidine kinase n=1 Tax=Sulfitobacter sabulilitoris TaxID=2562655 RepID=A0A5S3PL56_9RHOB|nr:ATP-binding protein [Sulfitobacter sabulilitoris]TMM55164.1 hypothetical protein FDT80_06255 [Sulfitobacter sabulilitoris]
MDFIRTFIVFDGRSAPLADGIAPNLPVLYINVFADLLIAVSLFAVPAITLVFLRRRKIDALYTPLLLLVVFIFASGVIHLMSVAAVFLPIYGLQGVMKLITGVISFVTVIALWKMLPQALKIPSPASLLAALAEKEAEIADRKTAEATLRTRNMQLDGKIAEVVAANEELREFSYAASHDMKSPANTLCLWLEDFQTEYSDDLPPHAHESLRDAAEIIARMRTLVEDILSYSRVVNRQTDGPATVDCNAIVATTVHDLGPALAKAGTQLDVSRMPTFEGYPPLVSILIHNLLSNAIKFRAPDRPNRITISGETTSGDAPAFVLRVRDNGIGIDPAHGQRIFRLFRRLHNAETYDGTGLGLALCRRVAVIHGGTITVQSQENEGAEFIVTFPQETEHVTQAA